MQDTQLRWMFGLSVLVLALVAAVSMGEGEEPDGIDPDATAVVFPVDDIEQVVRVEREVSGERMDLVLEQGTWQMTSPASSEADPRVIDRLLDDLREMDRGIPIDVGDTDPSEFGLGDPPAARIRLTLADGSSHTLEYGEKAPVGYRTYARDVDGQVVAVGGRSELLTEPSSMFRDHRLFAFDPAQVRRVTLEVPPNTLTVRGEGTRWWVEGFTRADADRVDDLVMGLLDLRFDRVLEVGDPIAEPRAIVEVELADGDVRQARIGDRTPMGDLAEGPRAQGMVFPDSLAILGMGPTDIGDPQAIPLSIERDTRIEVEHGGQRWSASREGTVWRAADRSDADTWARLKRITEARIQYQAEPVEPPADTWATVTVFRGDDSRQVRIGPPTAAGVHRAQDRDGGQPYLVPEPDLVWVTEGR